MIVALTLRQWHNLVKATGLGEAFDAIARLMDVDLDDEGGRFVVREVLGATLKPWVLARTLEELRDTFDHYGVSWGPYQTFTELVERDPRCSPQNPMFAEVDQPMIGRYLVPGSPLAFSDAERLAPTAAPVLGEHTDDVLAGLLGLVTARSARCTSAASWQARRRRDVDRCRRVDRQACRYRWDTSKRDTPCCSSTDVGAMWSGSRVGKAPGPRPQQAFRTRRRDDRIRRKWHSCQPTPVHSVVIGEVGDNRDRLTNAMSAARQVVNGVVLSPFAPRQVTGALCARDPFAPGDRARPARRAGPARSAAG